MAHSNFSKEIQDNIEQVDLLGKELMAKTDYKELLKKYIAHIVYHEGITFIDDTSTVNFNEDELKTLKELE